MRLAVAGLVALLPLAGATVSGVSGRLAGGYETNTGPTSLIIEATFLNGISSNGDVVRMDFTAALFITSGTGTCTAAGGSLPVFSSATTDALGQQLTCHLSTSQIGGGETITFTFSDVLTVLPAAGAVSVDILSTADGASGSIPLFNIIPAADVTLINPVPLIAGVTPTRLDVEFQQYKDSATGDQIVITADKAVFGLLQSGSVGAGSTVSLVPSTTGSISSAATYSTDNTGTELRVDTAQNHAAGALLTFLLYPPVLAALPSDAGLVTLTMASNVPAGAATADYIAVTDSSFGTIVVPAPSPAGAGSDPIARMGDVQRKFELPLHTMTPLLMAPELLVRGSVFPGNPSEQWFDHMIFSDPAQTRYLEVKVKKGLEHRNASHVHPMKFGTLDITYGTSDLRHTWKASGVKTQIPFGFLGHQIVFRKLRRGGHHVRLPVVGGFRRECIDIAGPSVHFYVCSTPADEYYGHLHKLALRNMHLDLMFIEIRDHAQLAGLLPELWGTQPMSETTRSYLVPEEIERNSTALYEGEANETGVCKAQEHRCTKMGCSPMTESCLAGPLIDG